MSYWEIVKNENPVIFKMIQNAVNNKQVSHAFIISSTEKRSIDNEWKFIVESLISKTPFTENVSSVDNYVDLTIIDGSEELIKKEVVINSIAKLSETPFESGGKKILVIKNIDNSNKHSLNSLLKFLEEPTDGTFIIMTTSKIYNVLNTIKSRSQIINLREKSKTAIINVLVESEFPYPKIFASIVQNKNEASSIPKPKKLIEDAISLLEEGINNPISISSNIYEYFTKENAIWMARVINVFFNDIWKIEQNEGFAFDNTDLIKKYNKFNYSMALEALDEFTYALSKNANMSVMLPALALKLEEAYE